jgi:hypothetical protein
MIGEAASYIRSIRSPSSYWLLKEINCIPPPTNKSGSVKEFGIQIFACQPNLSGFIFPKNFFLKIKLI